MYTATMRYSFKEKDFEEACRLWEEIVLAPAKNAKGLVRMQLLAAKPKALAIGTWTEKKYAEEFMRTGIFKTLKERIVSMQTAEPESELWELRDFYQA